MKSLKDYLAESQSVERMTWDEVKSLIALLEKAEKVIATIGRNEEMPFPSRLFYMRSARALESTLDQVRRLNFALESGRPETTGD